MLHKVLLKVIVPGGKLEWKYFCSVPQSIYHDFISVVNPDDLDFNVYLSLWARRDWGVTLKMALVEDITRLKTLIVASSKRAYSELYVFNSFGLVPSEDFWVKFWVSSHMRSETERLRAE